MRDCWPQYVTACSAAEGWPDVPLPDGGNWPPAKLAPVYDKLAVWSAWYAGDPDMLAQVYGGQSGNDQTRTGFFASQTGGLKSTVRNFFQRWFWGTATPPTEQRTKLHIPIAGDIASTSADLLFSEPPTLTVEHAGTQERLDDLVDDGMHATLLEAAEVDAALGGVYLRVCWDREVVEDRPWLAAVHADAAVPDWSYGRLTAVTFWQVLADDGREVVRHLERHEKGAILHGVYVGTRDELGRRVALTDMPETASLADAITEDGDVIATGVPYLTASYIPNMRPNRIWRTVPEAAYCGRSDYAGVEGLMDAFDEVYSSWMRDLRLAKARLIVPETYLQSQGRGEGATWNSEQEIYSTVAALGNPNSTGLQVTPAQFAIRMAEHRDTAQHFLDAIVRGAGYSAATFGEKDEAEITATEVKARERRSNITRDKKITYWRPGLADALEALLAVDRAVFGSSVEPVKPDMEFGDVVSEDPQALAQTAQLLRAAEAASTETIVQMVHPDWKEDDVKAEVAKITEERQASMPEQFGEEESEPDAPSPNGNEPMEEEFA
jgi:A118 family predicted phage portal protein